MERVLSDFRGVRSERARGGGTPTHSQPPHTHEKGKPPHFLISLSPLKTQMSEPQAEVLPFLSDPATWGGEPVKVIQTHGAHVFLAGAQALKVQRVVRYPFMDFSTLEKRRIACEKEASMNAKNAPRIYKGVIPIVRGRADGVLRLGALESVEAARRHLSATTEEAGEARKGAQETSQSAGGDDEVVEYAIAMCRFEEENVLSSVARRGELTKSMICDLVDLIGEFHSQASEKRDARGAEAMQWIVEDNSKELVEYAEMGFVDREVNWGREKQLGRENGRGEGRCLLS